MVRARTLRRVGYGGRSRPSTFHVTVPPIMAKPKPSPIPKTPALVRGRLLGIALGVGLTGLGCGGLATGGSGDSGGAPQPLPPQPLPDTDGSDGDDAEFDGIAPQPLPFPDADTGDAESDATIFLPAMDAGEDGPDDAMADHVILVPPPLPPPHP
jgi:hypothetical protein